MKVFAITVINEIAKLATERELATTTTELNLKKFWTRMNYPRSLAFGTPYSKKYSLLAQFLLVQKACLILPGLFFYPHPLTGDFIVTVLVSDNIIF